MTFEKALIKKNYVIFPSTNSILSYCNPIDKTSQINLTKENNLYKFSFPLGDIHYATYILGGCLIIFIFIMLPILKINKNLRSI